MLAVGPFDEWSQLIMLLVAVAASYWAILWLSAVIWTYRDVKDRGSDVLSQIVAVLLVLVFNLPGLILYLILRPHETLAEAYIRNLETEAMIHDMDQQEVCYACQKPIRQDFAFCPHCRIRLQQSCASCGKAMSLNWAICPYCGKDRTAVAPAVATPPAAAQPAASGPPAAVPPPMLTVTPMASETETPGTPAIEAASPDNIS